MKKWSIVIVAICISLLALSQTKAPQEVRDALADKYASAQITGSKISGDVWVMNFSNLKGDHRAEYKADGTWVNTQTKVELSDLPKPIAATLNSSFSGYIAYTAALYSSPTMKGYAVKLRNGDNLMETVLDTEGNILVPSALEEAR